MIQFNVGCRLYGQNALISDYWVNILGGFAYVSENNFFERVVMFYTVKVSNVFSAVFTTSAYQKITIKMRGEKITAIFIGNHFRQN